MNNTAVVIDHVNFQYSDGHRVLHDLSCRIQHGEKVALIGPNGAGKSTFMSLLNGLLVPSDGHIQIDGLPLTKQNLIAIRRKIGIVFQDPDDQLFSPTVFDDVAFGPLNLGLPVDQVKSRVEEALKIVGLSDYSQRVPFHLSFGEKKRLALATVLSYRPDILVFDEPSTNMDPLNRRNLINWLKDCEKTVILCTHDLDIALEVCNRCILLVEGKIIADGHTSELLHDRQLLEQHHLELPLALLTHDILHDLLESIQMDEEHKKIIGQFLHTHRHIHGSDHRVHYHIHAHPHGEEHVHESVTEKHIHELGHNHIHESTHATIPIPHSHDHNGNDKNKKKSKNKREE